VRARPAILLLSLAGCAVGPDYKRPPVALNASWNAKDPRLAQAEIDQQWWHSFGDATLDRLIEIARRQNLPLQVAGLRILEARAQLGIAVGRQYPSNPSPIGSGTIGGLHTPQSGQPDLNLYFGEYNVGFDALWEIDFWGKFRRGVRAAKASWLATVAERDDALVSLTAEVARTWFAIRTTAVLLALTRENVAVQEDGQRIAQSRFKNGATSELDVAQATSQLESTRSSVPELELELTQAENALCTLLGEAVGCASSRVGDKPGLPSVPQLVALGLPADLLRRRPDIRAAELSAIAQCDRIGMAKAELFPSFQLFGAIGTRTVDVSGAPTNVSSILNLFGFGSLLYTAGLNLLWPVLNYPKILNGVRVQDARFQQLLFKYQQAVLKAAEEVEDGVAGFLREQEAATFADNAVGAAQNSVRIAMVQYREGAVDFQRVLDAERALLTTQNRLATVRSAAATQLVALYKALGGGWELERGRPAVTDATRDEMKKRTNWGSYLTR
jgi:NodT family efflux transporter outer membrane factor (OMF) lipoprotein